MNIPRIFLLVLTLILAMPVAAQTWPSKPVTIVVPFPAGGGADVIARFIAEQLHGRTGQPFLVENKPGASSMLGTQAVANAAPDGYTLLLGSVSAAMNVHVFKKRAYDLRDFTPVTTLSTSAFMLVVNPQMVPVNSVAELTEYIRARPDKIAYGGAGSGSIVAASLFLSLSGLRREQLTLIQYRGVPDSLHDLIGGRIQFTILEATSGTQQARGGKVRALAITSTTRTSAAPEVPTMAEAGLPAYDLVGWYALFMPAKTPKQIAQKLAELCNASMTTEKGRAFLKSLAMDPKPGSPENFAQFLNDDMAKWGRLIKDAGIEVQ